MVTVVEFGVGAAVVVEGVMVASAAGETEDVEVVGAAVVGADAA